jgi:hypothetical protein
LPSSWLLAEFFRYLIVAGKLELNRCDTMALFWIRV